MPYNDKEKQKEYLHNHYKANKELYIGRAHKSRERRKDVVRESKNAPCMDCGVQYPYYVMHYDHTKKNKLDNIGKLVSTASLQTLLDEIVKCDLVCANCHAERSHKRHQYSKKESFRELG